MKKFYEGKKVFVTGHTGFKGSWLCCLLGYLGAEVYGYALKPPTDPSLYEIAKINDYVENTEGDIRDYAALQKAVSRTQPEIVFHLAAQPIVREGYAHPRETYETNAMGTVNLLEAVRHAPSVRSFVVVTTDKVYRNDGRGSGYDEGDILDGYDPYANSKSMSELATGCYRRSFFSEPEKRNISISTVRAGNVIGGGDFAKDRLIPDAYRALEKGTDLVLRNPSHVRPFWHVLDACYAYLLLAWKQYDDKSVAGCYNVGPNEGDIWDVGRMSKRFAECVASSAGRRLAVLEEEEAGVHEDAVLVLNSDRFSKIFHWRPQWDTDTAVAMTAEWYGCYFSGDNAAELMERQCREFLADDRRYGS